MFKTAVALVGGAAGLAAAVRYYPRGIAFANAPHDKDGGHIYRRTAQKAYFADCFAVAIPAHSVGRYVGSNYRVVDIAEVNDVFFNVLFNSQIFQLRNKIVKTFTGEDLVTDIPVTRSPPHMIHGFEVLDTSKQETLCSAGSGVFTWLAVTEEKPQWVGDDHNVVLYFGSIVQTEAPLMRFITTVFSPFHLLFSKVILQQAAHGVVDEYISRQQKR